MKKYLKTLGVIISVTMVAITFIGCGAWPESNEEDESSVIEYTCMWKESEPQANWLKSTAASFEKETGNTVKINFEGRDVLTKIKSRLIMKKPPDIVDQDLNELTAALLNENSFAIPLDDLFQQEGPEGQTHLSDIFNPSLLYLYKNEDKAYFLPYEFVTSCFMYDKNMFNNNSIQVPKDWTEFMAIGQKLKTKGISPLALDTDINFYNAYYYYWAVERVMGPGCLSKVALDKSGQSWSEPGYLKAAELISKLSKAKDEFFNNGYENINYPYGQGKWAEGKSASILCGTWIPVETQKKVAQSFDYGFYPFPIVSGGIGKVTDVEGTLIGCAIPENAKNIKGAKEFLKYMVNKKNANNFAKDTISISARTDIEYPKVLAPMKTMVQNARYFFKPYDGVMSDAPEWFANVFYPLDNKLIFGEISAQEFINQIKKKTIDYYKGKS